MVFGRVESGYEICERIERLRTDSNDKPGDRVTIVNCGEIKKVVEEIKKEENVQPKTQQTPANEEAPVKKTEEEREQKRRSRSRSLSSSRSVSSSEERRRRKKEKKHKKSKHIKKHDKHRRSRSRS